MCFYSYYRILNAKNQLKVLILNNSCWFYRHYSIVWLFKISYGPHNMNHIIWTISYGPYETYYMGHRICFIWFIRRNIAAFVFLTIPDPWFLTRVPPKFNIKQEKNMFHLIGPILYDLYNIFILLQATVSTVISHFWIIFCLFWSATTFNWRLRF